MVSALSVSRKVLSAITRLGVAARLTSPSAVGLVSGAVTETPVSASVMVAGPIGETLSMQAEGAQASFTMSAYRLAIVPKPGYRITLNSRTWLINTVVAHSLNGQVVAYEMAASESAEVT